MGVQGGHTHENGVACSHVGGTTDIPSYHTRDLIVKDDIMAKTKELAEVIFNSAEVQQYRKAEQQINDNERVKSLIGQIKKKQKEVVAFEKTFKNPDMVKKIEAEMETLQDELDGIPIVAQFQQSQSDINYLLQLVVTVIRDTVSDRINMEDVTPEEDPETCSD
ncbi:hypothetical protein B1748_26115 [Paenibacillus sp. MY03]|jgi:cell fate (sporulation/competence/biofilm development) regulator YmcA (YheA/YmcA/DUF963 family)|uniref:RicAFT regulatory complex protein RicA family protein n=1 Tax=Paenibacillus sp. MY03 TaxID=302980 RepID=UPI000B3D1FC3|nr:YlbF family regulator [Paenibacillus sp. MY03]OUS71629.1 hypothetical protein B1748_26115 [Paenibacillus sp. MY03]